MHIKYMVCPSLRKARESAPPSMKNNKSLAATTIAASFLKKNDVGKCLRSWVKNTENIPKQTTMKAKEKDLQKKSAI